MAEVEVCDLPADDNTGDTGEVVVQPCPESSVDNLLTEVARRVVVPYCVQIPRWPTRVEPVDIKVDLVRAEERPEHLGHCRRNRAVRGRVLWVVRRGQERPPARLLDGSWVTVVITRYGAEAVVCDCGGVKRSVDRSDRPPEQVMVLGVQGKNAKMKDGKEKQVMPVSTAEYNPCGWRAWLNNTTITLGMQNVFDADPPFVAASFENGYDESLATIKGRFWYVQLKKRF